LLADRARSECARSMRAVGIPCTHLPVIDVEKEVRQPLFEAPSADPSRKMLIESPAERLSQNTQDDPPPIKQ
jgi:hypothetical protein